MLITACHQRVKKGKDQGIILMKFKKTTAFITFFIMAGLLLTACSGFRLKDALEEGHLETIRYASFFEGSSEHLTREEFEVYKDSIMEAIEKDDKEGREGIRLERSLKGEVLYISPYTVTISDLSPDLKIFLNGRELNNDYRSNAIKAVLNPGDNEIRFVLSSGYLEDEKTLILDTASQPGHDLTLSSGYGFRTVTVNSQDSQAYFNINGVDYMQLKSGMNRIEYIPSVPLTVKSVSQDGMGSSSKEIILEEGLDSISLKLTEQASTKPMATGSGETLTQPTTTDPSTKISHLTGTPADPLEMVNELLQARMLDLNNGVYAEVTPYVLNGSNLAEDWQLGLDPQNSDIHLFLGTENGRLTVITPTSGYVEVDVRMRTTDNAGTAEETFGRYRYYFNVTPEGNIGFYDARPLN